MRTSPTETIRMIAAGALACALAACGGGNKSSSAATTPAPAPAASTVPTEEPVSTPSSTATAASPASVLGNMGGGGVSTGGADGDMATFFLDLDNEQNIVPVLKLGAQRAGCDILGEQDNPPAVAVKCPGGAVAILQEGKKLGVGCPAIDDEQCRQVFGSILQAAMKLIEEQKGAS